MSNFLEPDYKSPDEGGGYTKFPEGEVRLRILSKPLMFWEVWNNEKPTRYPFNQNEAKPIEKAKHVWAMSVYNYTTGRMQVCSLHQQSIKSAIERFCKDTDYGNPFGYDIKIVRKGMTMNDTEYSVVPSPPKPVSEIVKAAFKATPINLNELMKSDGKPFGEGGETDMPEVKSEPEPEPMKKPNPIVTNDDDFPF